MDTAQQELIAALARRLNGHRPSARRHPGPIPDPRPEPRREPGPEPELEVLIDLDAPDEELSRRAR